MRYRYVHLLVGTVVGSFLFYPILLNETKKKTWHYKASHSSLRGPMFAWEGVGYGEQPEIIILQRMLMSGERFPVFHYGIKVKPRWYEVKINKKKISPVLGKTLLIVNDREGRPVQIEIDSKTLNYRNLVKNKVRSYRIFWESHVKEHVE